MCSNEDCGPSPPSSAGSEQGPRGAQTHLHSTLAVWDFHLGGIILSIISSKRVFIMHFSQRTDVSEKEWKNASWALDNPQFLKNKTALLRFNWYAVGFPGGSVVKNLPAMQETWVQSLDREDPLEKEMATHSSILAWRIPWTEEPGVAKRWTWLRD